MFQVLPHRGKVSNRQVLDSEEMLSPIPSGKHTKNYGKIHHAIHGKIHDFYADFVMFHSFLYVYHTG